MPSTATNTHTTTTLTEPTLSYPPPPLTTTISNSSNNSNSYLPDFNIHYDDLIDILTLSGAEPEFSQVEDALTSLRPFLLDDNKRLQVISFIELLALYTYIIEYTLVGSIGTSGGARDNNSNSNTASYGGSRTPVRPSTSPTSARYRQYNTDTNNNSNNAAGNRIDTTTTTSPNRHLERSSTIYSTPHNSDPHSSSLTYKPIQSDWTLPTHHLANTTLTDEEVRREYDYLDIYGIQRLTYANLKQVLQLRDIDVNDTDITQWINTYDSNNKGYLTYNDYYNIYKQAKKIPQLVVKYDYLLGKQMEAEAVLKGHNYDDRTVTEKQLKRYVIIAVYKYLHMYIPICMPFYFRSCINIYLLYIITINIFIFE